MSKKIKSISFLFRDTRLVLEAQPSGRFKIPHTYLGDSGSLKTTYRNLTARQVINHASVRSGDPVLTLETGEKVRVFQGGDPSYLPAMTEGLLIAHDTPVPKKINLRNLKSNKIKKPTSSKSPSERDTLDDYDGYQYGFDDYGDWGP